MNGGRNQKGVPRNQLSQRQAFELFQWIGTEADISDGEALLLPPEQVADVATARLGFKVTRANVERGRKVQGLEPCRVYRTSNRGSVNVMTRVRDLTAEVQALHGRIIALEELMTKPSNANGI